MVDLIQNFENLKVLVAANCDVEDIPGVIQRLSNSIEFLDLSGNFLSQELTEDHFESLTVLHTVRFQCMGIKEFNFDIFPIPTNMVNIDIGKNDISAMSYDNFNFSSIKKLSIPKCHLSDDTLKHIKGHLKGQLTYDECSCDGSISKYLLLCMFAFFSFSSFYFWHRHVLAD